MEDLHWRTVPRCSDEIHQHYTVLSQICSSWAKTKHFFSLSCCAAAETLDWTSLCCSCVRGKRWLWPVAANNRTGLISETQRSAGSAFPAASVPNTLSTAHQQSPPDPTLPRITLQRGDTHPPSSRPGTACSPAAEVAISAPTLWINKTLDYTVLASVYMLPVFTSFVSLSREKQDPRWN